MSLKGFAVLYGEQMSELGITTDELFQQKSLFDFSVNAENRTPTTEKKLIENPVQNFGSLPKETLKKLPETTPTSPIKFKIQAPTQAQTNPRREKPLKTTIQSQQKITSQPSPTTITQPQTKQIPQISTKPQTQTPIQSQTPAQPQIKIQTQATKNTTIQQKISVGNLNSHQEIPNCTQKPEKPTPTIQLATSKLQNPSTPITPQTTPEKEKKPNQNSLLVTVEKSFKPLFKGSTKNRLKEAKVFSILLVSVLTLFFFFTNAQLVMVMAQDLFNSNTTQETELLLEENQMHPSAETKEETLQELQQLEAQFEKIKKNKIQTQTISTTMQEFLDKKGDEHAIDFNTLPPGNRLIIPDLNINAPLIDTEENGVIDFSRELFDEELTKGVVKYPTTPIPGNKGNTLIFGHTSTEWWKKNEYGVIFRNIPKLKAGQRFYVIWNGKKTTYEMVERKVVRPKDVENYYHEFSDKGESYLTLMGCYPIGTADKRMMVVAKKVAE